MIIFAIDDEKTLLDQLKDAVSQAEPGASVYGFNRASGALEAIEKEGLIPDVIFSDIEMPGMDGLALAVKIKQSAPDAHIIFVTGYSKYALEAYHRHVNGYIMKPVDAEAIREELDHLPAALMPEQEKLFVRCFGKFEIFWKNEPVHFSRSRTKEVFAYLVDREGAACTSDEIAVALWENENLYQDSKAGIRKLVQDMRATLKRIGQEDVIVRKAGELAIRSDRIDCDYYRMLSGDPAAVQAFHGEYMQQYSWASLTEGNLFFRFIQ